MIREEKIKRLKALKARCERLIVSSDRGPEEWRKDAEALDLALTALRPVSREQVEKVWRGEWVGVPNMGVYDTACSKCGYCPGIRFWDSDFCPNCGAPMTDEAVDMVMERLEALYENIHND